MLAYDIEIQIYYNNKNISTWMNPYSSFCMANELPKDTIEYGSWDLLERTIKSNLLVLGKKGKRIFGYVDALFPIAREKKTPEIQITVIKRYKEVFPSISEILNFRNSQLSIQYLKERGLTLCPISGK